SGGALSITVPASTVNLGSTAAGSLSYGPAALGSTTVADNRGNLVAVWTVTVSSTDFANTTTGGSSADETVTKANVAYVSGPATSAFAQTAPPSGSIGIGLLEAPVSREGDPRARTYIVDHLAQGATIQRKIEVSNGTSTTQEIQLYSGAATIGDGEFVAVE